MRIGARRTKTNLVERLPFRKRCADASAASNERRQRNERAVFGRALSILRVFDLEQVRNGSLPRLRVRTYRPALRLRPVAWMANNGAEGRKTAPLYRLSRRLAPPLPPSRAQEWWKGVRMALVS